MDTLNISALPSQSEPVITINAQPLPQIDSALSFKDAYAQTSSVTLVNNGDTSSLTLPLANNLTQAKTLNDPPAVLVEAVIDAINSALSISATKRATEDLTRSTAKTTDTGQETEEALEIFMIVTQGATGALHEPPVAETETRLAFGMITDPITPVPEFKLNQGIQTEKNIPGQSKESKNKKQDLSLPIDIDVNFQNIAHRASVTTNDRPAKHTTTVETSPVHTDAPDYIKATEKSLIEVKHENVLILTAEPEIYQPHLMILSSLSSENQSAAKTPHPAPESEYGTVRTIDGANPRFFREVSSTDADAGEETEIKLSFVGNDTKSTTAMDTLSNSQAPILGLVQHKSPGNSPRGTVNIDGSNESSTSNTLTIITQATRYLNRYENVSTDRNPDTQEIDQRNFLLVQPNTADKDFELKSHKAVKIQMPQMNENEVFSSLTVAANTSGIDYRILSEQKSRNLFAQEQTSSSELEKLTAYTAKTTEIKSQESKASQLQMQTDNNLDIEPNRVPRLNTSMTHKLHSNKGEFFIPHNNSVEGEIIENTKSVSTKTNDELTGLNLDLHTHAKEKIERKKSSSVSFLPPTDDSIETSGHEQTQPKVTVLRSPLQNIAPEIARDLKSAAIIEDLRFRALERQVITAARDGMNQIRMQLYPPGIGQILIRLTLDGSKLRLQIRTSSTEATNSLNEMKDALRSALSESGFTITSLDVTDGNNDPNDDRKREKNQSTSQELQSDIPEFSLELQA